MKEKNSSAAGGTWETANRTVCRRILRNLSKIYDGVFLRK